MATRLEENWDLRFEEGPLLRGLGYFEQELVTVHEDKNGWYGDVDGSERYRVRIALNESEQASPIAQNSMCTCPHFASGHLCKHLAAACFEAERIVDGQLEDEERNNAISDEDTIEHALAQLDNEALRGFLREIITADNAWRRVFLDRFSEPDAQRSCREVRNDIQRIIHEHSFRGYIDWDESFSLESDIAPAIERAARPFLDKRSHAEALEVSIAALEELRFVRTDDPDTFIDLAIEPCLAIWSAILSHADDPTTKDLLFDTANSILESEPHYSDAHDAIEYAKADIIEWLVEHFTDDPYTADRILSLAQEYAMIAPNAEPDDPFQRSRARWALVCLQAMSALGATRDERKAFALPFMPNPEVRQAIIDDALLAGNRTEAYQLLRDGERQLQNALEQAVKTSSWRATSLIRMLSSFSEQILNMLEEDENRSAAIDQLRNLISLDQDSANALQHAARLRNLIGEDDWPTERDVVLSSVSSENIRRELLAHEGLIDQLMENISQTGSVYDLMRYEDALIPQYSKHILKAYMDKLTDDITRASSRKTYRTSLAILKRYGRIDGGKPLREKACEWVRATFPRKRALLDELDELERTWM